MSRVRYRILLLAHNRALRVAESHALRVDNPWLDERSRNRASAHMHRAYQRAFALRRAAARAHYVSMVALNWGHA